MDLFSVCRALSDRDLVETVESITADDRRCTVKLLVHLAEMEQRKLAEELGYPSLFHYCTQKLRFSEAMAVWRMHTARAAKDYPAILSHLESGRLNITTAKLIAPYLNKHNQEEIIAAACGKTRKEVEAMVAALDPLPQRRDVVVRGPLIMAKARWPENPPLEPEAKTAGSAAPLLHDVVEALDAERRRLHFDVGPDTAELIERAREILRHKYPFATLEDIVREALNLLLDRKDPGRALEKSGERPARESDSESRRIPRWVRRAVWRRDGGQCVFVADDGHACGARAWLEFDHIVPWAKGGPSDDPGNVRLLCRAHNQAAARRAFG